MFPTVRQHVAHNIAAILDCSGHFVRPLSFPVFAQHCFFKMTSKPAPKAAVKGAKKEAAGNGSAGNVSNKKISSGVASDISTWKVTIFASPAFGTSFESKKTKPQHREIGGHF